MDLGSSQLKQCTCGWEVITDTHAYLATSLVMLAPGCHDKGIVYRDTRNDLSASLRQLVKV